VYINSVDGVSDHGIHIKFHLRRFLGGIHMEIDLQPLKEYLLQNIITSVDSIDDDEPLFSSGLVDSFGMLDLLFFISEEYGISIEHFEITDNGVDTLTELGNLIEEKKGEY